MDEKESGLSFYDNLEIIFHNIYREEKQNGEELPDDGAQHKMERVDESIKSITRRTDEMSMRRCVTWVCVCVVRMNTHNGELFVCPITKRR